MTVARISNQDFVVGYATSETLDQVADTLHMNKPAVVARRKFLEEKGVIFPRLKSGNFLTALDIAQLNSLIIKHDIRKRG